MAPRRCSGGDSSTASIAFAEKGEQDAHCGTLASSRDPYPTVVKNWKQDWPIVLCASE